MKILFLIGFLLMSISTYSQDTLYGITKKGGKYNSGVIFSFEPNSKTYNTIHSFHTTPGNEPHSTILKTSKNRYFGTTFHGGFYGSGILYEYIPSEDTIYTLFEFHDSSGAYPDGKLIEYEDIIIGTANGSPGSIFSYNPNTNQFNKILDLTDESGRRGTITLINNELFVVTSYGGTYDCGTIIKINLETYVWQKLHDFKDYSSTRHICKKDYNIYGTAKTPLPEEKGIIFSFNVQNNTYKEIFSGNDSINPNSIITLVDSNILLGVDDNKFYQFNLSDSTIKVGKYISGGYISGLSQLSNGDIYGTSMTGGDHLGYLFNYDYKTDKLLILQKFYWDGPYYPIDDLTEISSDIIIGITRFNNRGKGSIYKFDIKNNQLTESYSFGYSMKGYNPYYIIFLNKHEIIGTCSSGGKYNQGTIFKFNIQSQKYELLYDFTDPPTHSSMPRGNLIIQGNSLYGATAQGLFNFNLNTGTYDHLISLTEVVGISISSDGKYIIGITNEQLFNYNILTNSIITLPFNDYQMTNSPMYNYPSRIRQNNIFATSRFGGTNFEYIYPIESPTFGTLYEYDIMENKLNILFEFDKINGRYPLCKPLINSDVLYGTTSSGGLYNNGTLFKYNISDKSFVKLYDINTYSDYGPYGELLLHKQKLYGLFNTHYGSIYSFDLVDSLFNIEYAFDGVNGKYPVFGLLLNDSCGDSDLNSGIVIISPNPSSDYISIQINSEYNNIKKLSIYNINGILAKEFSNDINLWQIDIRNLQPGVYFVKIVLPNNAVYIDKFVKTDFIN